MDWWYRCRFSGPGPLRFDGLATLAEIWIDGNCRLRTKNMHRSYRLDVDDGAHELVLAFRAMELAAKRPRPRWKTALIAEQNLRWFRTTLLGHIPGWSRGGARSGPWRGVHLGEAPPRVWASGDGSLRWEGNLLEIGGERLHGGQGRLSDFQPWWPHTQGEPVLYPCRVDGREANAVGFRTIAVDRTHGRVQLVINGVPVFCRGACWTIGSVADVERAREAGANMIRIGGTMTYPSDEIVEACDRLGILIWQDFMFANMDYPFDDPEFREEVTAEVTEQLARPNPALAVWCGGSEVHQQAAMLGLSLEMNPLVDELCAGRPYFPSTPCEGPLPFHTSVGLTHYYGVGAYRRPLADVRRARVRFTPECLGFSNVPETLALSKSGVPRDSGAGWDFEDVRDHYLGELFHLDPVELRSVDPTRYLLLSRVVTGEVMLRTCAEWRTSDCGGALVWFWKDLEPGAGWGILDHQGRPKPVWWYLRRAWARQAVFLTDEGLDGLDLHVIDEVGGFEGTLELELLNHGRRVAIASQPSHAGRHSGDALLGYFADLTHAYRFGPPKHDVVVARLRSSAAVIAEDFYFPGGHSLPTQEGCLTATAHASDAEVVLTLTTSRFLQAVHFDSAWAPDDNWFHMAPGTRQVRFRPSGDARPFKAHVAAINLSDEVTVRA